MGWKTCATDVSPIVQPCRVWQHLGKSDLGQRRLRPRARETNVPSWGKSGRRLLMLRFSQFDPKRPFGTQRLNFRHGWWKAGPFGHLMFRGIPLLERYPE